MANLKTLQALVLSDNRYSTIRAQTNPRAEELAIGATGVTDLFPLGDLNLAF
jgi:hypothetical protein